jgi:hypothetical protein
VHPNILWRFVFSFVLGVRCWGEGGAVRRPDVIRNRCKCCGALREPTLPTCIGLFAKTVPLNFKIVLAMKIKIASEFYNFKMTRFFKSFIKLDVYLVDQFGINRLQLFQIYL